MKQASALTKIIYKPISHERIFQKQLYILFQQQQTNLAKGICVVEEMIKFEKFYISINNTAIYLLAKLGLLEPNLEGLPLLSSLLITLLSTIKKLNCERKKLGLNLN